MRIMPCDGQAIVIHNGSIEVSLKTTVWSVNRTVWISVPESVTNSETARYSSPLSNKPFKAAIVSTSQGNMCTGNAVNMVFQCGVL